MVCRGLFLGISDTMMFVLHAHFLLVHCTHMERIFNSILGLVWWCILMDYCCCIRWAGGREDKFFARIGKNIISVYETETFTLIDKKSIKVENVVDFIWSPTDPILALFVPELGGGNQPARVISLTYLLTVLYIHM